jgi:hypothetical protein
MVVVVGIKILGIHFQYQDRKYTEYTNNGALNNRTKQIKQKQSRMNESRTTDEQ